VWQSAATHHRVVHVEKKEIEIRVDAAGERDAAFGRTSTPKIEKGLFDV